MANNRKDIWYIKPARKEGGKPFWMRIGTGWVNKDNSVNLEFDVTPPDMKNIQLRDYVEKTDKFGEE